MKHHNLDPLNVNGRLYEQVSKLLDQLAKPSVTLRERTMALAAIARIQQIFVKLRDENREPENAGSTVRKYAASFQANAARGRARLSRPQPAPEPDDDDREFESDFDDPA